MADEHDPRNVTDPSESTRPVPEITSEEKLDDFLKDPNLDSESNPQKHISAKHAQEGHFSSRSRHVCADFAYWLHRNGWKILLSILLLVALVASVLIAVRIISFQKEQSTVEEITEARLPIGASVADISIGNMTRDEAIQAIRSAIGDSYTANDMVVNLGSQTLTIPADKAMSGPNPEWIVDDAFQISQDDPEKIVALDLLPYLGLDNSYISAAIELAVSGNTYEPTPPSYRLEGTQPALSADKYDAESSCQTLILTQGIPGSRPNAESILEAITDAYTRRDFIVDLQFPVLPESLDIDAIYEELHIDPVNTVQDPDTFDITYGSCGYTFDLEKAKEAFSKTEHGQSLSIPMEYVLPEALTIPMEYPAKLAVYTTPLSTNENYNNNLALACTLFDERVLEPGEILSVKNMLPKPIDISAFSFAPMHAGYCQSEARDGGMDQFASTMHGAVICADLEVIQRHNPHHICPYTELGTEVSISAKNYDFRFRNNYAYPVQIRAKIVGEELMISIWSKEARDYTCKVESVVSGTKGFPIIEVEKSAREYATGDTVRMGVNGCQASIYRVYINKETGEETKRVREWYVNLPPVDHLVAVVK